MKFKDQYLIFLILIFLTFIIGIGMTYFNFNLGIIVMWGAIISTNLGFLIHGGVKQKKISNLN